MQHVFIVAYGRSGSTLIARLLNEIDGYVIRGENGGIVRTLANSVRILGAAGTLARHVPDNVDSPWYGFKAVDLDQWRLGLANEFQRCILAPPPGTRATGFKEIRYATEDMDEELFLATMDFLTEGFENSRIVFNTRNWKEVVQSSWWKTDYTPEHARQVISATDQRFRECHARLGPERSFKIDYADYNGKPEGFLPLLDWLGESLPMETIERVCAKQLRHANDSGLGKVRRWISNMKSHSL